VLKAPPIAMLRAAVKASRSRKEARLAQIESKRKQLATKERAAQERVDLTSQSLRRIHRAALENLENVLQEKEQLEQECALALAAGSEDGPEEDLEELSQIASEAVELGRRKRLQ
jgi:hypothetical protein